MPFSRWGAAPFVYSPILFPEDGIAKLRHGQRDTIEPNQHAKPRLRAFQLALLWQGQIREDPLLNKARIAAREGISRARVTQIMALLELPAEIRGDLLHPPAAAHISSFPERRLRILDKCRDESEQVRRWRKWLREIREPSLEVNQDPLLCGR
jgi:hypothetical protein